MVFIANHDIQCVIVADHLFINNLSSFSPPTYRPHQHLHCSGLDIIRAPYVAVQFYYKHSLAPYTRELYTCDIQHYLQFCNLIDQPSLPTFQQTLLYFTTYVTLQHYSSSTIQTYLVAVYHLHLSTNYLTVYACMQHLAYFWSSTSLMRIKRHETCMCPPTQWLLITIDIMHWIK